MIKIEPSAEDLRILKIMKLWASLPEEACLDEETKILRTNAISWLPFIIYNIAYKDYQQSVNMWVRKDPEALITIDGGRKVPYKKIFTCQPAAYYNHNIVKDETPEEVELDGDVVRCAQCKLDAWINRYKVTQQIIEKVEYR